MPRFEDLNIDPKILELKESEYERLALVVQPGRPITVSWDDMKFAEMGINEAIWLQEALRIAIDHAKQKDEVPEELVQSNLSTHAQPSESADPVHLTGDENIGSPIKEEL